jgi:CRISPR-associated protein Csa3
VRTYLSPIGFNSTSVTRSVLSHGLDTGDRIVLVRPIGEGDQDRANEAVADVERLVSEVEPDVEVTISQVTYDEFDTAVMECSDLLRAADGELVANLGGGARDVLLPFAIAVLAHLDRVDDVLFFSDIDGRVHEWTLPSLTAAPSDPAWRTLEALAEIGGEASIPDLTDAADASKSTITRHVTELADKQLVRTWRDGKTKHAELRLGGTLLLRARP